MKLYVPDIGDTLKLSKDWKFYLQSEYRQRLDLDQFGTGNTVSRDSIQFYKDQDDFNEVIIPKGSVLKVDRVYIRKGSSGFSSITFLLKEVDGKKVKSQRFWAHLRECNKIEFEEAQKSVNIQWPHSYIIRDKSSLPNSIAGVKHVFRHNVFSSHGADSQIARIHDMKHRYEKSITLQGQIDGKNIPYIIRENVDFRPLTEDEKRKIKESGYYDRQYTGFFGIKKKDASKALDNALKIEDFKLEIVDEKGEVVKTYRSLNSAKKWIKDKLEK